MTTHDSALDTGVHAGNGTAKIIGIIAIIGGVILMVAGVTTWVMITNKLQAEQIVVSEDAGCAAGQTVGGPLSAFCQAEVINKHALEATGGKTFAELARDDPKRSVAMDASFLRASLFTSVVSYGVAAMAAGLGLLFVLVGVALNSLSRPLVR
jgi:hypothetical protein